MNIKMDEDHFEKRVFLNIELWVIKYRNYGCIKACKYYKTWQCANSCITKVERWQGLVESKGEKQGKYNNFLISCSGWGINRPGL